MAVKNRFSFRFKIPEFTFIALLIFSGMMLAFSSGSFVISFRQIGFSFLSSIQKGVNTVAHGFLSSVNSVHELAGLRKENQILKEKLQNYEFMQRNNVEITKENARLKELLDFSNSIEQKNYPARIIGRDIDTFSSGITIDKGSRNGIRKGMPVIAIQEGTIGLVGKIISVGLWTSVVMPIYDLKCSVSGRILNTRDIGLLSGKGSPDYPLGMKYIKKRVLEELNYGDIVVTSGETENYIRDIPIGTISKIAVLDYDSSLDIDITPIVDFSRLETVIVTDLKDLNPNYQAGEAS